MLPDWIEKVSVARFVVDPDGAYPAVMELFGYDPEMSIDRYHLEMVYVGIKREAQHLISLSGEDPRPDRTLELIIRGSKGYKERWGFRGKPLGRWKELEAEHGDNTYRVVAQEAIVLYKRTRRGMS